MERRTRELDPETGYKECFRVFSKDQDGCITAEEMKYVGSLSCWLCSALTVADNVYTLFQVCPDAFTRKDHL